VSWLNGAKPIDIAPPIHKISTRKYLLGSSGTSKDLCTIMLGFQKSTWKQTSLWSMHINTCPYGSKLKRHYHP
jgi:ribosome modulation factor